MAQQLETLTAQYVAARNTHDNSQLGPKTDRAAARMEAIMVKAERLGLVADLTKALGY